MAAVEAAGVPRGTAPDARPEGRPPCAWVHLFVFSVTWTLFGPVLATLVGLDHSGRAGLAIAVSALGLAFFVSSGQHLTLGFTWTFFHLYFLVAGSTQLAARQFPLPGPLPRSDELFDSWLLLGLFFACYCFGYWLSPSDLGTPVQNEPHESKLRTRTLLVLASAPVGAVAMLILAGGIAALTDSREEFNDLVAPGGFSSAAGSTSSLSGLLIKALRLVPLSAALLAWRAPLGRVNQIAISACALALLNPIVTPRFVAGAAAIGLVLASASSSERWRLDTQARRLCLTLLGSMLAVFLTFGFQSFSSARRSGQQLELRTVSNTSLLESGDYSQFQQVTNAIRYVDLNGTSGGFQLVGALFNFVPRSFWPSKPVDTGVLVARESWGGNASASLPVELYVDFGWLGVVVGAVATGWLSFRLDSELRGAGARLGSVAAVALWVLLLRGTAQTFFSTAIPLVVFLVGMRLAAGLGRSDPP